MVQTKINTLLLTMSIIYVVGVYVEFSGLFKNNSIEHIEHIENIEPTQIEYNGPNKLTIEHKIDDDISIGIGMYSMECIDSTETGYGSSKVTHQTLYLDGSITYNKKSAYFGLTRFVKTPELLGYKFINFENKKHVIRLVFIKYGIVNDNFSNIMYDIYESNELYEKHETKNIKTGKLTANIKKLLYNTDELNELVNFIERHLKYFYFL